MKILAITALVIFILSCYWCGIIGTWDFIQTIPSLEKNSHTRNYPWQICLFFPVLVPLFCVIPYGYKNYYYACCLMQTRNWITIGVWIVCTAIITLCGFPAMLIATVFLYSLKWFVVTEKMETIIQSAGNPKNLALGIPPLQYEIEGLPPEYSVTYISALDWIDLCMFTATSVASCFICPRLYCFYLITPVLSILFWTIVFCKYKALLTGCRFRISGKSFLAIINIVFVIVYFAYFVMSLVLFDSNYLLTTFFAPVIWCKSLNKFVGYLFSSCTK